MKSYTDIEQSKKLAEILPVKSADQTWEMTAIAGTDVLIHSDTAYILNIKIGIPCWSLAALLDIIPDEIQDDTDLYHLKMYKENSEYCLVYTNVWDNEDTIETDMYESMIDACYETIIKLHEEKLL